MTSQFPELACLNRLPLGTVLDGELVVLQGGKLSLRHIQRRTFLQSHARIEFVSRLTPATYVVFDLLYFSGKPVLAVPLSQRRETMRELIHEAALPGVLISEAVRNQGCELFAQVSSLGLEGIMAKRLDAPYLPGKRPRYWLKIKTAWASIRPPASLTTAVAL